MNDVLFLDIGGVFLTNGWDHHSRHHVAQLFALDEAEINSRHGLMFDTYEIGKITLDEYLKHVIFYQPRPFSVEEFKRFMFSRSQSYPEMIELIRTIKTQYGLKTIAVNNEGRELMEYRIKTFHLKEWIDYFVCSSFVGLRKPDEAIYRLALDLVQVEPEQVIYIDDRPLLIEIGKQLGMQTIQHVDVIQTKKILEDLLTSVSSSKGFL
jgi:putative hydrolase of the HAD superfamily